MNRLCDIAMSAVMKLARVARKIVRTTLVAAGLALLLIVMDALLLRDDHPRSARSAGL